MGHRAMSSPPLVCWIVVNTVPYHEARIDAAAEADGLRVCIVQITEVDSFRVLQRPRESTSTQRHTLFPGVPWDRVDRREMVKRLHRCLDEVKPAVICINGWSFGGGVAALQWGVKHDVPIVVMSESTAYDDKRYWWSELIKKKIIGLCSSALVGGAPHRTYMKALGVEEESIFSGYDAVDNKHFRRGADRARLQDRELRAALGLPARYFLACSRFTPKKNLVGLLTAYARYRRQQVTDSWSLIIVGDGEQTPELQWRCETLGITNDVRLVGAKPYEELPAYYGLASAFVHASTTEQWGLVVNEAMAAGLPVLVSNRCGCAPDLIRDGVNGFTFDPFNVEDIARVMFKCAESKARLVEMGQAGSRR